MLLNSRLSFELRIFPKIRMRNTKLFLRLVRRFLTSKILLILFKQSEGPMYIVEKFLSFTENHDFKVVAIEVTAEPGPHRPKSESVN